MTDVNAILDEMKKEAEAVFNNMKNMEGFIQSGTIFQLPAEQQLLLVEQLNHMTCYVNVLNFRIMSLSYNLSKDEAH